MADVALRIDVLFDTAQVLGQFLADGHLLLVFLDLDRARLCHLPGGFLYLMFLLVGEVHAIKVKLQLARVIGNLALLAHLAPEFAGHVFNTGDKGTDLVLLLGKDFLVFVILLGKLLLKISFLLGDFLLMVGFHVANMLLMVSLHLPDTSLVLLPHGLGIGQLLQAVLRLGRTTVKLVALKKQSLYQLLV